jgi:putative zinc finger protein
VTCDAARDLFSALVDEALSAEQGRDLDAHLASCAECRRELEAFRRTLALLRSAAPIRAPIGFVDRVLAAVHPIPWYRRLARALFLPLGLKLPIEAAAVLVVGVLAVSLYRETRHFELVTRPESPRPSVSDGLQRTVPLAPPSVSPPPGEERQGAQHTLRSGPVTPRPESGDRAPRKEEAGKATGDLGTPEDSASMMKTEPGASGERAGAPESSAPSQRLQSARAPEQRASDQRAVDVAGRLAVTDRTVAETALADVVSRLGGVILARRADAEATVVDVRVPRAAYAELIRSLAGIGRWTPDSEVGQLPDQVRLTLRLSL